MCRLLCLVRRFRERLTLGTRGRGFRFSRLLFGFLALLCRLGFLRGLCGKLLLLLLQMIEQLLFQCFLAPGSTRLPVDVSKRFLLFRQCLSLLSHLPGFLALLFEHFGKSCGIVFQHLSQLVLDPVLFGLELLLFSSLLLVELLLCFLVVPLSHLGGLLLGFLRPFPGLLGDLLLTIGEIVQFRDHVVDAVGFFQRLLQGIEILDGLVDVFLRVAGFGDPLVLVVGYGNQVRFFHRFRDRNVCNLLGFLGLLAEEGGIERGRQFIESIAGGLASFAELIQGRFG